MALCVKMPDGTEGWGLNDIGFQVVGRIFGLIHQGGHVPVSLEQDVSAPPAHTAGGYSAWNEFLLAKSDHAFAALTRLQIYFRAVYKHSTFRSTKWSS